MRHAPRGKTSRLPRGKAAPGKPTPGKRLRGRGGPAGKRPKLRPRAPLKVTPLPGAPVEGPRGIRLNRFLASAGICSRRAADDMIRGGRVSVNGEHVRELGVRIDPEHDVVRFDGTKIQPEKPVYVLFNKPKEVVCTNATNEQRRRVIDYMPSVRGRIYTVGRLDAESEGLILLTNEGEFAQQIAHPSHGVPKTYAVLLRGRLAREDLERARGGVWLAEGKTGGARIVIERQGADRTYLKVTLREGKNREIRRIFAKLGYSVLGLKRVRIGRLSLHGLKEGEWRFLTRSEVDDLLAVAREADLPDGGPPEVR